jgi:hypothetical protein
MLYGLFTTHTVVAWNAEIKERKQAKASGAEQRSPHVPPSLNLRHLGANLASSVRAGRGAQRLARSAGKLTPVEKKSGIQFGGRPADELVTTSRLAERRSGRHPAKRT